MCVCADPLITTMLSDLYAVDIENMMNVSASGSVSMVGTTAAVVSGTTRYQRLLDIPIAYNVKHTDEFSLTITYQGMLACTRLREC